MPKSSSAAPCPLRLLDPNLRLWAGCEGGMVGLFFVFAVGELRDWRLLVELPAEAAEATMRALVLWRDGREKLCRLEVGCGYELERLPSDSVVFRCSLDALEPRLPASDVEVPARLLPEVIELLCLALDQVDLTAEADL